MSVTRIAALVAALVVHSPPAGAETWKLVNGDQVTGELISQSDERVVLQHEVFGRMELPLSQVAPEKGPSPGLLGTPFLAGWERTFHLGVNGQQGNAETADVLAALDLDYEDETTRWLVDARYTFASASSATTKHNALLELNRDKDLGRSDWFWFASGRWDWDQFRSWDQRLSVSSGIGYPLVQGERFTLRGRTGPTLTREIGGTDQWLYEVLLGLEAEWAIDEDHSIEVNNRFFQALNSGQPFRNLTTARWRWRLTDDPGLSLNVGIENEYISDPLPDSQGNDFRYFTSLGIDF